MQSFWMLAGALAFSLCAACIKLGAADFSGYEIVFYRSAVTLVLVAALMRHRAISFGTRHAFGHFMRSFTGYVSMTLWTFSIPLLALGTSQTLNASSPLFIAAAAIAASLFTRRPVAWRHVAAIVLGFAGICAMLRPDFTQGEALGVVLGLSSAACGAAAFWSIRQLACAGEPSERIVFYLSVWCLVFSGGCALADGGFSPVSLRGAFTLAGVGVFAAAGQFFTTLAYGKGNFLLTSVLSYSAIVISWLIGMAVFDDAFAWASLAGMLLVIAAGVVSAAGAKKDS